MDKVIYIVKWVSIFQAILILFFIVLMYSAKAFFVYTEKRKKEKRENVLQQLNAHLEQHKPIASSEQLINYLKKSIEDVLFFINETEQKSKKSDYFYQLKDELSQTVLKPRARVLSQSRKWYNRYTATLCFSHGFSKEDVPVISKLICDDVVLVSVNAAQLSIKYENPILINTMITFFSKGRRLQQSVYADLMTQTSHNISPIIEHRLNKEKDLYVKIYCYRLLAELPPQKKVITNVEKDIQIESKDLKIAILNYVSKIDDKFKDNIIYSAAEDPSWEVKAVAAKLLGELNSTKSLTLLNHMLKESQWWVRINAAQSLGKQGKKGIDILKNQSEEQDKFAYEVATKVLKQLETIE